MGPRAGTGPDAILEVDLLRFEHGSAAARRAVVDGTRRSLETGFVYTSHDLPESLIDEAYGLLRTFVTLDQPIKERFVAAGAHGQTGYTGVLVETAASSRTADWKEMLAWGPTVAPGHPLRLRHPHTYRDQMLPEEVVPGITAVLTRFRDSILDLQRRFLRVIAAGLGAHDDLFDDMLRDSPTLTRAVRYPAMAEAPGAGHVWAAEHADINLITALPRATAPGLQVRTAEGWVDAVAPERAVIMNTGLMLERMSNGLIPPGVHRVVGGPDAGERYSVVQFCQPTPWTVLAPLAACCLPEHPQRFAAIEAGSMLDDVLWQINLADS
ncbi:MAG: isopenicillin N synthase family dioxygenase [Acidimicrobiales bacterium]